MEYNFPGDLKPAPVRHRDRFYREQFPTDEIAERMERWPQFTPVIDVGSETTLYRPRFKDAKGKLVRLTDFSTVQELQDKIVEYAPEDIYYNRTLQKEGQVEVDPEQELVFKLVPWRADCRHCDRKREYMDEQFYQFVFCEDCFEQTAFETRNLYAFLERHFGDMGIFYTGRGFQVHVNDDAGYKMPRSDREELAAKVASEFPIEEGITAGETELVRLPGSLNGLVSRKVTKVAVSDLNDPEHILTQKAVPTTV